MFSGEEGKRVNKKLFKGAILETILLNLINDGSQEGLHGYAIFVQVKKLFGIRLGPSTLYPELKSLESHGLVNSFWETCQGKPRKKYKITRKGQNLLKEYFAELKVVTTTAPFFCQSSNSCVQPPTIL